MKDIRYWVGKVLTPEQAVEKKPEPKHSITERLKYEQEQQKQTQEQKTPKQKKQNMSQDEIAVMDGGKCILQLRIRYNKLRKLKKA